jgi:hypothetical protein
VKQKGGRGGNSRQQQTYTAGRNDVGALPRGPGSGGSSSGGDRGGRGGYDREERGGGGRGGGGYDREERGGGGRGGYDREDRGGGGRSGGYDRDDRGGRGGGGYDRDDRGGRGGGGGGGYDRDGGDRGDRPRGHNRDDYEQRERYEERVKHPVPDVAPFTAFVGNVPFEMGAAEIAEWLGGADSVVEVRIKRRNAYVDFTVSCCARCSKCFS